MSNELPAPLTPAECDLADIPAMPLDVARLRDSELAVIEDPEAFRAAILLCCAAWHQVPAASLPDEDTALCRLAGYGRDLPTWHRAKQGGALHGFLRCADGRLYHPVVAARALDAWQAKVRQRARSRRGVEARWPDRAEAGADSGGDATDDMPPALPLALPAASRSAPKRPRGPKKPAAKAEKRPTRIAADWQPTAASVAFAETRGIDPRHEAERFRDFHLARGKPMLDWQACWRTWCQHPIRRSEAPAAPAAAAAGPDDWGAQAWLRKLPDIRPGIDPATGAEVPTLNGYMPLRMIALVCEAAGIPPSARPRLDAIADWLRDDIDLEPGVLDLIRRKARGIGTISSLKLFDATVRGAARRPGPAPSHAPAELL